MLFARLRAHRVKDQEGKDKGPERTAEGGLPLPGPPDPEALALPWHRVPLRSDPMSHIR